MCTLEIGWGITPNSNITSNSSWSYEFNTISMGKKHQDMMKLCPSQVSQPWELKLTSSIAECIMLTNPQARKIDKDINYKWKSNPTLDTFTCVIKVLVETLGSIAYTPIWLVTHENTHADFADAVSWVLKLLHYPLCLQRSDTEEKLRPSQMQLEVQMMLQTWPCGTGSLERTKICKTCNGVCSEKLGMP